ncbi:hypothetical protein PYW08_015581 [Mythimna loreyi]|uniref:Uncharacterized protein n=1 Tax=Mythimna loreyi TaxID=667449 RepID=A0ACC2R176_9NEOP|nr:hypothetical protein PYW08_015581 [Mythimna loreyi]
MRFQTTIILCIAATAQFVLGEVWEFGENVPTSQVVSHNKGDISLLEKQRTVLLTVPECHEIDYVRVVVDNVFSNPAVYYDKLTQTVTISYKPLQISMSKYSVVVKAKPKKTCTGTPAPVKPEPRRTPYSARSLERFCL